MNAGLKLDKNGWFESDHTEKSTKKIMDAVAE
jgi:hypothetical protein